MPSPEGITVMVSVADFEAGRLPRISPLSGAPATVARRMKYVTTPAGSPLLNGIGSLASAKRATGLVYLTAAENVTARTWHAMPWLVLALSVGLFVVSGLPQVPVPGLVFLIALACLVAFSAALFGVWPKIRPAAEVGEAQSGEPMVEFRDVHPDFVAAVARLYGQHSGPA